MRSIVALVLALSVTLGATVAQGYDLGSLAMLATSVVTWELSAGSYRGVCRVHPALPGAAIPGSSIVVASDDGGENYIFASDGRHLETRDALTNAVLRRFEWGGADELVAVHEYLGGLAPTSPDDPSNVTGLQVDRSMAGRLILHAAVDPTGTSTTLRLSDNHRVIGIDGPATSPASGSWQFEYWTQDGVLRSTTDPRNMVAYHNLPLGPDLLPGSDAASGLLVQELDPSFGITTLSRSTLSDGWNVLVHDSPTTDNPSGIATLYSRATPPNTPSDLRLGRESATVDRVVLGADESLAGNLISESLQFDNGTRTEISPSGTRVETTLAPDPRAAVAGGSYAHQLSISSGTHSVRTCHSRVVTSADASSHTTVDTTWFAVSGVCADSLADSDATPRATIVTQDSASGTTATFTSFGGAGSSDVERTVEERDPAGRMTSLLSAGSSTPTRFTYDGPQSRLQTVTFGTRALTFAYGPPGGAVTPWIRSVTSLDGATETFVRNAAGRVQSDQVTAGTRTLQVGYVYDASDNVTQLTTPAAHAYGFQYTPRNELFQVSSPIVATAADTPMQFDWDTSRRLHGVTMPSGRGATLGYTSLGQLDHVDVNEGASPRRHIAFGYEPVTGRLIRVAEVPQVITLEHADGDPPTATTWTDGARSWRVDQSYSLQQGRVGPETRTINGQSVDTSWDVDGRPQTATVRGLPQARWSWRSGQSPMGTDDTTVGVLATHRRFDAMGEFESESTVRGSTSLLFAERVGLVTLAPASVPCFAAIPAARDPVGRIQLREEEAEGTGAVGYSYHYDAFGRLDCAGRFTAVGSEEHRWVFDDEGNRTHADGALSTFDARNRVRAAGSATYHYNDDDQLESRVDGSGTTRFHYDLNGALRQVDLADGSHVGYTIDPLGRRVGRTRTTAAGVVSEDERFVYGVDGALVAVTDASGALISQFVYGSHPHVPDLMARCESTALAPCTSWALYRIVTDHLGSVRRVVPESVGTPAALDYDAWGVESGMSAGATIRGMPFGYAGGMRDAATRLVRFGLRDYEPAMGRWTARDPSLFEGGDSNLFSYVGNDPVGLADPSGTNPFVWAFVRGAGEDLAWQLITNGFCFRAVDWNSVVVSGVLGLLRPAFGFQNLGRSFVGNGRGVVAGLGRTERHHAFPRFLGGRDTQQLYVHNNCMEKSIGILAAHCRRRDSLIRLGSVGRR